MRLRQSSLWFSVLANVFLFSGGLAMVAASEAPEGWFLAGSHPQHYEVGITRSVSQDGKASAYLAAKASPSEGFGTLMQMFRADSYRGKRVRMTGYVRAETVDDWAGLWMRVDGPKRESLNFDNMQDRPISGTHDWQRYELVLDVPQESEEIALGILLHGQGKVYLDNLKFEEVDESVVVTGASRIRLFEPTNLDFEN